MESARERRKRMRMAVHWPIRLSRTENGGFIETMTEDLSSDGLYFLSVEPFAKGERLEWMLTVPARISGCAGLILRGHAQVARVKSLAQAGRFGVGCCIQDYSVIPITPGIPEPGDEDLAPVQF